MHLDLLGQRDDIVLVQLDHSIHINLIHPILVWTSVCREVLGVYSRLITEPLQQPPLHFRFHDEGVGGVPIRCLNMRDECGGIREELGL